MELTEHERRVIMLNRDYEQAVKEEAETLERALDAIGAFVAAHRSCVQNYSAREKLLGQSATHRQQGVSELQNKLRLCLSNVADDLEAWLILINEKAKQRHPWGAPPPA